MWPRSRFSSTVLAFSLLLAPSLSLGQSQPIDAVSGEPIPLMLAFESVARSLGYGFIGFGIPEVSVRLNFEGVDGRQLINSYASVYGLCHSYNDSAGALMVYPPDDEGTCPEVAGSPAIAPDPASDTGDVPEPVRTVRTPGGTVINVYGQTEPDMSSGGSPVVTAYESFNIRLRLLEINETAGLNAGISWGNGIFSTAAELVAGVANYDGGALPSSSLDDVVSFLETESIARRLDDVSLASFPGEKVTFRSGGDVNVQLVGSGQQNISKSFQFGLIIDVTPKRLSENVVRLDYSVQDVDPGNITDPTLITRNSQNLSGAQPVECGQSIVIGQFVRQRGESQGAGLPGLARIPIAGYAAGAGSTSEARRLYVLTLDLGCRTVDAMLEAKN